jgi:hypothetical protein
MRVVHRIALRGRLSLRKAERPRLQSKAGPHLRAVSGPTRDKEARDFLQSFAR